MKTLIIYMSVHHGNTEKIAQAIASELGADLIKATEAKAEIINNYDVIGFGSGIYYNKFNRQMIDFLQSLPTMSAKLVFVFSTSGTGRQENNAGFIKLLENKGCKILGDFACRGFDTFGPLRILLGGLAKGHPDAADIEAAKTWSRKVVGSTD